MKLILTFNLKPNVLFKEIQYNNALFDMMDAPRSVVNYINTNVDFTVMSCYKIYTITDKSLVSQNGGKTATRNNGNQMDDIQVDNGEANFHFTLIVPTKS